ncbi:MAG: M1 family aminopeptidase [Planctomycetota bacterium]
MATFAAAFLVPLSLLLPADAYEMTLSLDLEAGHLRGRERLVYENTAQASLAEIRLRLDLNLTAPGTLKVSGVKSAGGAELASRLGSFSFADLRSDDAQLIVVLEKPLEPGEAVAVDIEFSFTSPEVLNAELAVLQDDPYPSLDAWYPKAMSWRDGQWRCDDDRIASYRVAIDVPANLALASTGQVVEERTEGERQQLRLKAEGVRGFTIYGSPKWKVSSRPGKVPLRALLPEEAAAQAERLLGMVEDVIGYYEKDFGPYPASHLDVIGVLAASGGGAFAACNVLGLFWTKGIDERLQWLVAHEVAHQYFGNSVNQYRNDVYWVLIGLGLVIDRYYLADRGLPDDYHHNMIDMYRRAKSEGHDLSLTQKVEDLYRAKSPWSSRWNLGLGHAKAFAVCYLLEDLLGEPAFRAVIARLIEEHAGGMVTAGDLLDVCEEESGEDLRWFEVDWIEADATLDYAIVGVKRADAGTAVEIERHGTAAFPVLVQAKTAAGDLLQQRVRRDVRRQVLEFQTEAELSSVVIGPSGLYPDVKPADDRWPPAGTR